MNLYELQNCGKKQMTKFLAITLKSSLQYISQQIQQDYSAINVTPSIFCLKS